MSILLLGGPTAAGKSDLAIELAERHGAVLVSADAMTVYRGLDVGTAKPAPDVLARHPHACINIREVGEAFDVADFVVAVEDALRRNPRVIVVGGTSFYLQAIAKPLASLPPADPKVRAQLESLADPHASLAVVDPASASRLHPNDRVRVIRALEVHAITGRTLTELHAAGPRRAPFDVTVAWLDRDGLRTRIDHRLQLMHEAGYIEEVRRVLALPGARTTKPLRSFAYRHLVDHVDGRIVIDEALRRTARDTWRFARKQRTWARGLGWEPINAEVARSLAAACFSEEGNR